MLLVEIAVEEAKQLSLSRLVASHVVFNQVGAAFGDAREKELRNARNFGQKSENLTKRSTDGRKPLKEAKSTGKGSDTAATPLKVVIFG